MLAGMILLISVIIVTLYPTAWLTVLPFGISSSMVVSLLYEDKKKKKREEQKKKEPIQPFFPPNQTEKSESLDFVDDIFLDHTISATDKKRMLMIYKQEYLNTKAEEKPKRKELS